MKSTTPTLQGVLREAIAAALVDVHTAIPGKVVSYDKLKQTATVQPIIRKNATIKFPAIPDVPVMFGGNDDCSISWPVKKGDTGLLVFAEKSMDKWKASGGGDVDPGDGRRFDMSDASFIPALRSRNKAIPTDGIHDEAVVIRGPLVHLGGAAGVQPTFMADSFMTAFDTLIAAISTAVGGISGTGPQTAAGTAITTAKSAFDSSISASGKTTIAKVK